MSDLFREQAVEWQSDRLHGDVLILPRLSHTVILVFLLLCVTTAIWWLITNTYARKETVSGWLEPPNGINRIYAEDTGIIKRVLVNEGDMVFKDQPLIIVNSGRFLADGDLLENRLMNEYKIQQHLLEEQLERTANIYQHRRFDIQRQISITKQDLVIMDEQLTTLNTRHELAIAQVVRQRSLRTKDFISKADFDNTIANELALRNEQQALRRDRIMRLDDVDQLRTKLEQLPDQNANKIIQIRARMSEVAQHIAKLYGQHSYVIKAANRGLVNNIQAQVGQKVYAGSGIPLLAVIPSRAELSVHLLAPVHSVGFIEPGQALDIRYDAFPYQKFGLYKGKVVSVSNTVLMPKELLNTPLRLKEPVYQVTARLQHLQVQAYGKDFPLKAGMTLTADVRLGERTLLQWLLEPFYSMKGRL